MFDQHSSRPPRAVLGIASMVACFLMLLLLISSGRVGEKPQSRSVSGAPEQGPSPRLPPVRLDGHEIENLWLIGTWTHQEGKPGNALYCGATPDSSEAFARLKDLGVRTIISVDGASPEVETAAQFGITYVHVPLPYRGIESEIARELGQFMKQVEGGVYVHCHHGKHRGPAAASICARAVGLMDSSEALEFMKQVGTDPHYSGLYRDVTSFSSPPASEQATEYRHLKVGAAQRREPLVQAMVRIDQVFSSLSRNLDSQKDTGLTSREELTSMALLLAEELTEAGRHLETLGAQAETSDEFNLQSAMTQAARRAQELYEALREGQDNTTRVLLQQVQQDCKACHSTHRDR